VFTTDRLLVRDWAEADVPFVFDMYSRWEVARWLGAQPRALATEDEAAAAIQRWRSRSSDPPFGVWAVTDRTSGDVKGTVLLVPLPASHGPNDGAVEIGWHLHPYAWGHGYASEAGIGAASRGFESGLDEVYAVVRPDNAPSLAVCRRIGMTPLGRTSRWYGVELEAFHLGAPQSG